MYSTFVKQILMDSIHKLSQTPENYAVHPDTDFTRNRKIGLCAQPRAINLTGGNPV